MGGRLIDMSAGELRRFEDILSSKGLDAALIQEVLKNDGLAAEMVAALSHRHQPENWLVEGLSCVGKKMLVEDMPPGSFGWVDPYWVWPLSGGNTVRVQERKEVYPKQGKPISDLSIDREGVTRVPIFRSYTGAFWMLDILIWDHVPQPVSICFQAEPSVHRRLSLHQTRWLLQQLPGVAREGLKLYKSLPCKMSYYGFNATAGRRITIILGRSATDSVVTCGASRIEMFYEVVPEVLTLCRPLDDKKRVAYDLRIQHDTPSEDEKQVILRHLGQEMLDIIMQFCDECRSVGESFEYVVMEPTAEQLGFGDIASRIKFA